MVTEKAVTVREYRFRLVQKCKNVVNSRLSGDEILKFFWGGGTAPPQTLPNLPPRRLRRLVPPLKNPGYAPGGGAIW